MRIHTDHLTMTDIYSAALVARVSADVTRHGSKSRARAFNILLTGESKRRPNAGTGADRKEGLFAATWDQWGVFLAVLFEADNERAVLTTSLGDTERLMVTPYYATAEAFAAATGDRFGAPEDVMTAAGYRRLFKAIDPAFPEDYHGDHSFRYDGTPCEQVCKTKGVECSAVQRWGVRAQDFIERAY